MNTEKTLIDKLKRIEALFDGATTEGERNAASNALLKMKTRIKGLKETDPPIEYRFTMSDIWGRKLLLALLRRYEIKPFRYPRQRHTTVMAKVSKSFVDQTLWPEFEALNETLRSYLNEVTDRVISEGVHADDSEAFVIQPAIES